MHRGTPGPTEAHNNRAAQHTQEQYNAQAHRADKGAQMIHPAQPKHTNHWAPRTRKRHQQEHRPQRSTESSSLTQHAKGRTGDYPGPRKETTTRRNVTQGVWGCPTKGCLFKLDFPSAKFWVKIFSGWPGLREKRPPTSCKQSLVCCVDCFHACSALWHSRVWLCQESLDILRGMFPP